MDVDEDDEGTQKPRRVNDFGIEVDFESLDDDEREVGEPLCTLPSAILIWDVQDGSAETGAEFDSSIAKLNGEIERMAPNMKAMDR